MSIKLKRSLPARHPTNRISHSTSRNLSTPKKPTNFRHLFDRGLNLAILIGLGFLLVYGLFVRQGVKVAVDSTAYHPQATYQAAADKLTHGLSYRSKLTYNQKAVVDNLKQQFPEIDGAQVHLPLLSQRVGLNLNISKPEFLLKSAAVSYLIDQSGEVVSSNPTSASNLITINDQSGLRVSIGQKILSSDNIAFINQVVSQLRQAKVPIGYITLPALPQEFDLYTTDKTYYTKFYLGGDPVVQAGQFLAARNQFAQQKSDPSQYLDVRVAGKIFYK
jgi:hypothetical protein